MGSSQPAMGPRSTAVASILLFSTAALASPASSDSWVSTSTDDGRVFLRQIVEAPVASAVETKPASAIARSRTLYLNRGGAMLSPGNNNSQTQTSSIVNKVTQVSGWNATPDQWAATLACMHEIWAPFDVAITDVAPGNVPHIEALFGGSPAEVGLPDNVGGISPFTSDCSVIENSIVFAFTDNLPKQPRIICEIMSQEIAHSFGLDHEMLASDPMTYLPYSGPRSFKDEDAACGEKSARACGVSGKTCRPSQNSYQLLMSRLGAAGADNTPPSIGITTPAPNATVSAGFSISATATDNTAVTAVAFYLDGTLVATKTMAPYDLATDPSLARGAHTIVVEATDTGGNTAMMERDVVVSASGTSTGGGDDGGDGGDPLKLGCTAGGQPAFAVLGAFAALLVRRRRTR